MRDSRPATVPGESPRGRPTSPRGIQGNPKRLPRLSRAFALALLGLAGPAPLRDARGDSDGAAESVLSLYAPHGSPKGGFFNPWKKDPRSIWGLLRWKFFSRNPYDKSRPPVVPRVANDGSYLANADPGATFTWVGHATFAIHDGGDVILTDPHFGDRALIPVRAVPPGIPLEAVPADALAVISHDHYDHLDAGTVERLPASVEWFVPLGLADWFRARGRTRVVELDWWQSARRGRWTLTCLPSQHWSRRLGAGTNRSLWCAWLLDSGERRYFFAGDTGYFAGFAEFGRRFAPIDVALLPIGSYAPRWFMKYGHLNPEEAVEAFHDLGARTMLAMHWGTFDLTDEPLDLPAKRLRELVEGRREDPERIRILAVGERWRAAP